MGISLTPNAYLSPDSVEGSTPFLTSLDAVAGYRRLEWETDDGDTFKDLTFKGPMPGVKYRF